MKKFFKTLGKIIAGILILALLLVIALAVIPLTEKVPTAPAADAGDWMAALPDDRAISEYAKPAVAWAVANGIVTGFTDGTFQPQGNATREQMAAVMSRFDAAKQ